VFCEGGKVLIRHDSAPIRAESDDRPRRRSHRHRDGGEQREASLSLFLRESNSRHANRHERRKSARVTSRFAEEESGDRQSAKPPVSRYKQSQFPASVRAAGKDFACATTKRQYSAPGPCDRAGGWGQVTGYVSRLASEETRQRSSDEREREREREREKERERDASFVLAGTYLDTFQ